MIECYSQGKLLLSGEYMVLRGAEALAVPSSKGQSLKFITNDSKILDWESWDHKSQLWFSASLSLLKFDILKTSDAKIADRLVQILKAIRIQKNDFLSEFGGRVSTQLEFDRNWGLGTSSTLLSNMAQWSQTNPYALLQNTFGGSGYDIACATSKNPLIYKKNIAGPHIENCKFDPPFKSHLYLVYLNQKKNSREAINKFKKENISPHQIAKASALTRAMTKAESLKEFQAILCEHEHFIGEIIGLKPVKESLFPDFQGAIKSLGAWGGDFVLATGGNNTPSYFNQKGFPEVLPYSEMIF
jgi:mevalonate kinase